MTILPGLTTTRKERIPGFIADLRRSDVRLIALFPTCLEAAGRRELYRELEAIPGLRVPHVHLRSDCGDDEIEWLVGHLGAEVFNIHPRASTHPFGPLPARFASRIFIENVDVPADDDELKGTGGSPPGGSPPGGSPPGGLCPDFSHLENARLHGRTDHVERVMSQLRRFPVGCCHLSAIRPGVPNAWAGEWDHHEYSTLADLDYLAAYRAWMPAVWASLELENSLAGQVEARTRLEALFALCGFPNLAAGC